MRVITKQKFIAALEDAVVGHEDRKGPVGFYVEPWTGERCLVGEVLHLLGVDVPVDDPVNTKNVWSRRFGRFLGEHGVRMSQPVIDLAGDLQHAQDNGMTWGEAVRTQLQPS